MYWAKSLMGEYDGSSLLGQLGPMAPTEMAYRRFQEVPVPGRYQYQVPVLYQVPVAHGTWYGYEVWYAHQVQLWFEYHLLQYLVPGTYGIVCKKQEVPCIDI